MTAVRRIAPVADELPSAEIEAYLASLRGTRQPGIGLCDALGIGG